MPKCVLFFLSLYRNPEEQIITWWKYDLSSLRECLTFSPPRLWIVQRWRLRLSMTTVLWLCPQWVSLYTDAVVLFHTCWPGLAWPAWGGGKSVTYDLKIANYLCAIHLTISQTERNNDVEGHLAAFKSPTRKGGFYVLSSRFLLIILPVSQCDFRIYSLRKPFFFCCCPSLLTKRVWAEHFHDFL